MNTVFSSHQMSFGDASCYCCFIPSERMHYYVKDYQGNVRQVVDADGVYLLQLTSSHTSHTIKLTIKGR